MIIFFTSLPKHLFSSILSLKRHLAMTISSISAITVTLLLYSIFLMISTNINNFAVNIENELEIHASIDSLSDQSQIESLEKTIKSWDNVNNVVFSSSEDELNSLISSNGKVFERYKNKNPMPNAFLVEVSDAQSIKEITYKLNKLEGIEKAEYGGSSIQKMIDTLSFIHIGGLVLIISLLFITLFLITNTIKMSIYTRKDEIAIMRNVGAQNWFIKTPFVFEGFFIGILGSIFPIIITYLCYSILYDSLGGKFVSSMFILQPLYPYIWNICMLLLAGGTFVGMFGSFMAVSKYLRWQR